MGEEKAASALLPPLLMSLAALLGPRMDPSAYHENPAAAGELLPLLDTLTSVLGSWAHHPLAAAPMIALFEYGCAAVRVGGAGANRGG